MGLVIKHTLDLNSNKDGIVSVDTTGNYHVTDNPTGYGTPNRPKSYVVRTELEIIAPNGDVYTKEYTTGSDFIPVNTLTNEYLYSVLGLDNLMDGLYTASFIYYFSVESEVYRFYNNGITYDITSDGASLNDLIDGFADCDTVKVTLNSDSSVFQLFTIYDKEASNMKVYQEPLTLGIVEGNNELVLLEAAFKSNSYKLVLTNFENCFDQKIAGISILELEDCENSICTAKTVKKDVKKYIEQLKDLQLGYAAVQQQFDYELYEIANTNAIKLNSICANLNECC